MIQIQSHPAHDLAATINGLRVNDKELALWWLGQAGFIIKSAETCCIIDPYLSDSLAVKYRDAKLKHQRMTPIPVAPQELTAEEGLEDTDTLLSNRKVGWVLSRLRLKRAPRPGGKGSR